MKAVILAAGRGSRMKPLTYKTPKPLAVVNGKTFLEHIIDSLDGVCDEIIIVIGYLGDVIRRFINNKYPNLKIIFVEQKKLNGTGPALLLTKSFLVTPAPFFVFYADEYITPKEVQNSLKHEFSWLFRYFDHPEQSAVLSISKDKRILEVEEKPKNPKSNLVVGGMMLINKDIFNYKLKKHHTGEYYLTSMMKGFIRDHKVFAVHGVDFLSFSTVSDIDNFNNK